MFLIKDIKNNPVKYGIPLEFINLFDSFCDVCGCPMGITEGLTEYRCVNPQCPDKVAYRLVNLCKSLGVDLKFTEATSMIKKNNWVNPVEIFAHPQSRGYYTDITRERQKLLAKTIGGVKRLGVVEYIGYFGVIDTTRCGGYFGSCHSLEECKKILEDKLDSVSIKEDAQGIDMNILRDYFSLLENMTWLNNGLKYITID